jgi:hypothetical protein
LFVLFYFHEKSFHHEWVFAEEAEADPTEEVEAVSTNESEVTPGVDRHSPSSHKDVHQ